MQSWLSIGNEAQLPFENRSYNMRQNEDLCTGFVTLLQQNKRCVPDRMERSLGSSQECLGSSLRPQPTWHWYLRGSLPQQCSLQPAPFPLGPPQLLTTALLT